MNPPSENTIDVKTHRADHDQRMLHMKFREQQCHQRHHGAHQHAAQQAPGHVAGDDQPVWQRRDQQFLDVLAELRAEERATTLP